MLRINASARPMHVGTILAAGLVIVLAVLTWQLVDLLLLAFGGVLVAILLRNLARLLAHGTQLSVRGALTVVVIGLVVWPAC